jgi:hypothetical protein
MNFRRDLACVKCSKYSWEKDMRRFRRLYQASGVAKAVRFRERNPSKSDRQKEKARLAKQRLKKKL